MTHSLVFLYFCLLSNAKKQTNKQYFGIIYLPLCSLHIVIGNEKKPSSYQIVQKSTSAPKSLLILTLLDPFTESVWNLKSYCTQLVYLKEITRCIRLTLCICRSESKHKLIELFASLTDFYSSNLPPSPTAFDLTQAP